MNHRHLFGPVPSRRLGISLGIDLVPFKVCSYNCIYCEVGATTNLTMVRDEYVPVPAILEELDDCLSRRPELDYLTFSGAGEPTLHSGLGTIISHIRNHHPGYRIALITNSSLLPDSGLRAELSGIDLLMPSLDAVSDTVFQAINRPRPGLRSSDMVDALEQFRQESDAAMWLEIFLAPGVNDHPGELALLKAACQRIQPHRIQLNTLDRPGVVAGLRAMTPEEMDAVADVFRPLPVEVIAGFRSRTRAQGFDADMEVRIVETVSRRPCTAEDLRQTLGLHVNELNKYLGALVQQKKIRGRHEARGLFFEAEGRR